ncbi:sarcosine oxidase subunit gamma [Sagittula salina]|uniref:Sarcosine oxidase subunit gamma n=1 Tax=Sagittula salina TaxID=2820268 RepID=A0A940MWB9_9RHOB|nr:sarcosine oxidase subunit gamma [Sagittula salina]MBP0484064.1 sarcosine oxidase subunit gamma [Sagittula salina]
MTDLIARSPAFGLTPVAYGATTLTEGPWQQLTALMPFAGQTARICTALQDAYGLNFPAPGRLTRAGHTTCVWTGRGQAFLVGSEPVQDLARYAAVTDQSDAWVTLDLTGEQAAEVLARLVPLDLSPRAFGADHAARTLLGHAAIQLHRLENGFRIRGFRSMARTIVHETADAMAAVAARAALD